MSSSAANSPTQALQQLLPAYTIPAGSCSGDVQVVYKEQYDEKRQVLQEATTVDDMYDMLAVYEQKVVTADQVCH